MAGSAGATDPRTLHACGRVVSHRGLPWATWHVPPCVYFDSDETRNLIVATATLKIRAVNRIMRIGQGLGPWKLGESYVRRAGYEGRYPDTKPFQLAANHSGRRPASMGTGVASTGLGRW